MSIRRFEGDWSAAMEKRRSAGRFRELVLSSGTGIDFSSNDYLGLRRNSSVIEAGKKAAEEFGAGSGASRLVSGNYVLLTELEKALADWLGREACLTFSSGWQMNVSLLTTLAGKNDAIVIDRLAHNSLLRGSYWSGAQVLRFKHNDPDDARRCLQKASADGTKRIILITESVFSMDGDRAPLPQLSELCEEFEALFVVDEAHAVGVFGPRGTGLSAETAGAKPDILLGTFGKSFGAQGGFAAIPSVLKDFLTNEADGFVYSTAPVPFAVGAALCSLGLLQKMDKERETLLQNAAYLHRKLQEFSEQKVEQASHILPYVVGTEEQLAKLRQFLTSRNLKTAFIRPPTVPENSSRLRISLSVGHTIPQIDELINALRAFKHL